MTCPKEHTVGNLYVSTTMDIWPTARKHFAIWEPTTVRIEIKANVPMMLVALGAPNHHYGIFLYGEQVVEIPWVYVYPFLPEEP